jgi:hypothetical protein
MSDPYVNAIQALRLETWEGMQYDPLTGEAVVNNIQTTWFWATRVTQNLPPPAMPDAVHIPAGVQPWGFLGVPSAKRLMELITPKLPATCTGVVKQGDQNTIDAYSKLPIEVVVTCIDTEDHEYRFQAGLLASGIARTTNYDKVLKEVHQTYGAIDDMIVELNSQIAAQSVTS